MYINYINFSLPQTTFSLKEIVKNYQGLKKTKKDFETEIFTLQKLVNYPDSLPIFIGNEDDQKYNSLIKEMFDGNFCNPDDIDWVICLGDVDTLKNRCRPFHLVNAKYTEIKGNECSDLNYALYIANNLFLGDQSVNNIIIISEVVVDSENRMTNSFSINTDAFGVLLLQRTVNGGKKIGRTYFQTAQIDKNNEAVNRTEIMNSLDILFKKIYLELEAESYRIIVQNANVSLILSKLYSSGFDMSKIYIPQKINFHANNLDILINLKNLLDTTPANHEENYLLVGTGQNGSYAVTTLLK